MTTAPASWNVPRTDGLAIASLVLGLLGFGILPVVFGHIALARIRRTGDGGSGLAIGGLVLGYLALAAGAIVIVLAVVIPLVVVSVSGAS